MRAWGFFPYEAMEYKAAQDYLDRRSARGWVLDRVWLGFLARFRPSPGRKHFVDLDLERDVEGWESGYLRLCADAGWEKVQSLRGMLLFRSAPGQDPAPIQSDPELEQERFWKKYVRKNLLLTLGSLVYALLVIGVLRSLPGGGRSGLVTALSSPSVLFFGLVLLLGSALLVWEVGAAAVYLLRCRRAEELVLPFRRSTRIRSGLRLFILLLLVLSALLSVTEPLGLGVTADLALEPFTPSTTATVEACRPWPVVMGMDLGLDSAGCDSRYLDGRRSILEDFLSYSEIVDGAAGASHILTVERYEFPAEGLARWAMDRRQRETAQGKFTWGDLQWSREIVLPPCDKILTTWSRDTLLLRRGKVVALVRCTGLALDEPETLAVIFQRLAL